MSPYKSSNWGHPLIHCFFNSEVLVSQVLFPLSQSPFDKMIGGKFDSSLRGPPTRFFIGFTWSGFEKMNLVSYKPTASDEPTPSPEDVFPMPYWPLIPSTVSLLLPLLLLLASPCALAEASSQESTSQGLTSESPSQEPEFTPHREPASKRKIYKISIQGQKKIEKAAIASKLLSKIGQTYKRSNVSKEVRRIFNMGFFYNITVEKKSTPQGLHLTYTVIEKPSVLRISYHGHTEFDEEELAETSEIKVFEILNISKLQAAIGKIEKLYKDKGYYLAQVEYKISPVAKKNGIHIKFNIEENDPVTVKRVTFLGNKHLSREELTSVMQTRESGFFSFLSSTGSYNQEHLEQDIRRINFLYFNKGFVQVKVLSPTVTVTPDKREIFINFIIEEGEPFHVGSVHFTGDLLFTPEELQKETRTQEGQLFAYNRLQEDLLALQAKYGDKGYAFTNTVPRTRIVEEERLVHITFDIDKGPKVYIGQIHVKGNTKTRDKVIRRELRINEGELYSETKKRTSLRNVRRLGFFEDVNFVQSTPKDTLNIVNIDIQVKERQTGSLQIGAGYSDIQGMVLNGQVSQNNLFGRGQKLSATLNWSKRENIFNVDFTEPYFRDTRWLLGFNIYKTQRNFQTLYNDNRSGGEIRLGYPLTPYLTGILGYKIDETQLSLQANGDPDLFPVKTVNGLTSALTFSLVYDKRNDRFIPTEGIYTNFSIEYAGLGGGSKIHQGACDTEILQTPPVEHRS